MLEIFTQSFFINSLIAVIMISLVTGALGSFMIWQRLSYLGDSLSHSSLLGIALALIFNISPSVSIMLIAIMFAILLSLNFNKLYSADTILNIVTNVVLSSSLILMSFLPSGNNSIISSLFGDILMIDRSDIISIFLTSVIVTLILIFRWRYWLMISINQDLATVEKVNVNFVRLEFLIILAIFIAISAQLIGILLIAAFLLIPAASARLISKTPMQMIIVATVFSVISGVSGLILSASFDLLTGPAIILIAAVYLIIAYFIRLVLSRST
ncbi:metal ABC transporter permease [Wolbachia endosymbiont of Diaphorina citri]|jgi:ABC-type Mn2+/Zn2+ transport systems, permease components|uniref:metal ABC transporter permease n=1 Tax=Wolbachia endosymbiont of Diaphorina citri TaxID=116598 RepID=UPI000378C5CD|nr:metal ABC transporter permease [Wolbachia endosymbiont of Diaphorina citri]QJT93981.1 metal ABC transporter permease [Wolbachia endosymbiont of Diaphorina citri]QJT95222.1 metal ABC transporter permease [Wolbachia endosymbiont of Diaphorina citri]QJT96468.1 metal ABC transporter permease [Wolbachia endosymbiont of Diaphorina citri]QLK10878.1 metal ABC transporter permease [Wolbachia endosymbiont of Diaphorina citri]QXY86549.1 metal ABC transporter permease [Wolbachia endosymbiont of Diaphor